MSNGRLILGIGSGGDWFGELTTFGLSVDDVMRAEQLDEGLAILSALMSGEDAAHEGKTLQAQVDALPSCADSEANTDM